MLCSKEIDKLESELKTVQAEIEEYLNQLGKVV